MRLFVIRDSKTGKALKGFYEKKAGAKIVRNRKNGSRRRFIVSQIIGKYLVIRDNSMPILRMHR